MLRCASTVKAAPRLYTHGVEWILRRRRDGMWLTWWAHQDSNLEPKDYESSALTIEL
ncbi:hypothetical protein LUTEI9C_10001 [Luteimonas sp. 9C]|nr:hypothetical protein LUTEI9C_10001 [Luteimonas sp. 9C]